MTWVYGARTSGFAPAAWLQTLVAPRHEEFALRTRDLCAVPDGNRVAAGAAFALSVSRDGKSRVIEICGELDVATRHIVQRACLAGRPKTVVVEMGQTTFMDCSGYGSLVAARRTLQRHGGSLTLRNQAGQPAALLATLTALERTH
jgi:anti-anti-sigma factor